MTDEVIRLKGLTWDHPRATMPLQAALEPLAQAHPHISLTWDAQSLEAFEARPIAEAASNYDLIIFDHPHVGEVASGGLFLAVDRHLHSQGLGDADFVGPTLNSYRHSGATWGFPLDAACQVSCNRPDLLRRLELAAPTDWQGVLETGERAGKQGLQLAMGLKGVHSLMTLLTLCANLGAPLAGDPEGAFIDADAIREGLDAIFSLLEYCPPESLDWNSIAAQEAMALRDDLVLCPVVYGFAPYSRSGWPRRLAYTDLPGIREGSAGSTLGGAGLGISAACKTPDAALLVASYLVSAQAQCTIIPLNGGQPASAAAWNSPELDDYAGGFYSGTRRTLEHAWVRPRFSGFLKFQRAGGALIEACLRRESCVQDTLGNLERAWTKAVQGRD